MKLVMIGRGFDQVQHHVSCVPVLHQQSHDKNWLDSDVVDRNAFFNMLENNNRTRRYSHGSGALSPLAAPLNVQNSWGRVTPRDRLRQIRAEEFADVSNTREVAHEREIHNAMQMGQSCEDLTLVAGLASSPTRIHRFTSVVSPSSPSSTRKYTTRRSLSPNPLRASSFSPIPNRPTLLVGKRRCDEADSPLSKRMCTSDRLTPSTPGTPDSDSLDCTFRPVSPRAQPMNESPHESQDAQQNHKASPS